MTGMTFSQQSDDLEGKIRDSTEPLVLTDHLYRARVHAYGRARWRDLYRHFSKNLRAGRPYATLAGTKVLRMESRKSIEPWAKDRDLPAGRPRHPLPDFSPSLSEELSTFLAIQSVSLNVQQAVQKLAEYGTVSRETIPILLAVMHAMHADTRAASAEANARKDAIEIAKNNAALTQKLLSFDGVASDEEATGRSTH